VDDNAGRAEDGNAGGHGVDDNAGRAEDGNAGGHGEDDNAGGHGEDGNAGGDGEDDNAGGRGEDGYNADGQGEDDNAGGHGAEGNPNATGTSRPIVVKTAILSAVQAAKAKQQLAMAVWVVGNPNHGLPQDRAWHAVHSKSFDTQMKASRLHYCKNCNEQRITTKNMVSGAPCVLCAADSNRAFKFSKKNLMDVGSVDILFAQASVIEEQLVTVYRAAFQVSLLSNKHRRFPGHTITFPQAVGSWAVSLPWTMAEVKKSNMIVRSAMEGAEGVVKVADFAVRAEFVLRLIVLLKSVHPELYCGVGDPRAQALADMQKDNWLEELLVSVPDTTDFGTEGAGPAPQQHADSAAASAPDVVDNPWVFARGSGVAVPPATNLSGEFWKAVGAAMKDRLEFGSDGTGRNEEPLVNWPQQASAPLMESKYGAVVGAMPLRFGHTQRRPQQPASP
jgi:hypothetical protein